MPYPADDMTKWMNDTCLEMFYQQKYFPHYMREEEEINEGNIFYVGLV